MPAVATEQRNNMKKEEEIIPGMIVVVKSGGPEMTVAEICHDGSVNCVWFDAILSKPRTCNFVPVTLRKS